MGSNTKKRTPKSFTKIPVQEQSMYVRIEVVIPAGPGQNSEAEIEGAIEEAIEFLRTEGCAEVTEAYLIADSNSDACQILHERRVNGDVRIDFHGI